MVILFCKRRASDLSVMPPVSAFCGYNILSEEVDALIDFGRLWEVITPCCHLGDCFSIGD